MRHLLPVALVLWIAATAVRISVVAQEPAPPPPEHAGVHFKTAQTCMACHNGLTAASGEDVSIGSDWRASIMANSSRDPYWQSAVRRETLDHPKAAAEIEDECAICHMPMSRARANAEGRKGQVFAHLPVAETGKDDDLLAHDGVSCTMCHQITGRGLGTPASFTGGFEVLTGPDEPRPVFGPFQIDKGRTRIMQSASGFQPTESAHMRGSEICATCHTLYTKALGADGRSVGTLPEQVPYLEWRHSAFPAEGQTCQSCHMPVVRGEAPIASVLGAARQGLSRHVFRGGNALMLRMLNRYRTELGVAALPQELDRTLRSTIGFLQSETASLTIERAVLSGGRLDVDVLVANMAGHKLPSGYPSRRAWIDLAVRDRDGQVAFESGRLAEDGSIAGNDNDRNGALYEPHYSEIREAGQVQVYESILVDAAGAVTTGLLRALRYAKDNRLIPRGFDKATAHEDFAVVGAARDDGDFTGGSDRVRYVVDVTKFNGPFTVTATLYFQPIGFRWARNLQDYDSAETRRFVRYYDSLAGSSAEVLARAATRTP